MGGADLTLTQKYLSKKHRMQQEKSAKAKKEIDRKASKNRKLRYVVHDKILNFLTPVQNLQAVEGREALVGNLFGVKNKTVISSDNNNMTGKKRSKKAKYAAMLKENEEDDIALI